MLWELWYQGWAVTRLGGPGSGHHGHSGRPGKRGGSLAGTRAVSASWNVFEAEYETFFGDATKEEVEGAFAISGLQAELVVSSGDPGAVDMWVTWQDAKGKEVGSAERTLRVTPDGEKDAWEGRTFDLSPEFQDRGLATNLYESQVALARKMGYPKMKINASGTVGRYAWAKEGYEYADPGRAQRATSKFQAWAVTKGVTPPDGGWPVFENAREVAEYKHPAGITLTKAETPGFENDDVPPDMELQLGKGFMLDQSKDGHGTWDGVMHL